MTLTAFFLVLAIVAHAWALAVATWLAQTTAIGQRAWAIALAGILISGVHAGLLFSAVLRGELHESLALGVSALLVGVYFFVALWLSRPVLTGVVRRAELQDRTAQRYLGLVENLPLGVLIAESGPGHSRHIEFNSELARFLDLEDHTRHVHIDALTHPDSQDAVSSQLARLASATMVPEEQRFVLRDGRVQWGIVRAFAMPGNDGEPPITLVTVQDVTERRRGAERLVEERNRAQMLLNIVDVMLVTADLHGRVKMANQKAASVLGIPVQAMIGLAWPELGFRDESRQLASDLLQALVDGETGKHASFEGQHDATGNRPRVVSWRCTSVHDDVGSITGVLCAGIDVTERAEAMARYRQERGRVQSIMETSPIAILVADGSGELVYVNKEAEAMLGPRNESSGKSFVEQAAWTITDWNGAPIPFDGLPFVHVSRTGDAVRDGRYALRWPDGRQLRLLVNISPLRAERHGLDGMVATLQDVTEALARDARARSAERTDALQRLSLGVAHDFNNILTTMVGCAEIGIAEGHPPTTELFQAILRRAIDATELTGRLQSIGSSQPMAPEKLRLPEIVDTARAAGQHTEGVLLDSHTLHEHPHLRVAADRAALEMVLRSLLRNAREAAGPEGKVELGWELTGSATRDGGDAMLCLTVTDSGPGIPPELRERMFEPYFSTRPGKPGLGLSEAASVVGRLGGSIEVAEGSPTRLSVWLPVVDLSETPAPPPPRTGIAGLPKGQESVLLVEDEREVEFLLKTILERQGYTVIAATNLADARAKLAHMPRLDLLLTDVLLPDGKGNELARELRDGHPSLPVLFTSGMPGDSFDSTLGGDAPVVFVSKPFTASEIAIAVRRALDA